jgi:hypothetical protein
MYGLFMCLYNPGLISLAYASCSVHPARTAIAPTTSLQHPLNLTFNTKYYMRTCGSGSGSGLLRSDVFTAPKAGTFLPLPKF